MKRQILIGWLLFTVSLLHADNLKSFTDPRSAIKAARNENKLIVFLLYDSNDGAHKSVFEQLEKELHILSTEFVMVKCAVSQQSYRDLFSGRFGKDLSSLPVAVVTDSTGSEITSFQGVQDDKGYRKMIITARIEGGLIDDPVKLANLRESLTTVGEKGGFLAPMVGDLGRKKVAITPMMEWKKKDGTVFTAMLLEALGDTGNFIDEQGKSIRVKFIDLSQENITYLQTKLTSG
ncbi:MAG: hypothetical protein P1V20_30135 [Verrucomicrobiales bacterium]|nr:hypothetical protein [Verrucomicrobiales bacterium]